jgi:hypothetical protein
MLHRLLVLVVAAALSGCAARTLDDLSSSYERLVASRTSSSTAPDRPRTAPSPPAESGGASFLALGNSAIDAAEARGVDPTLRIALYRLAAASAHHVLVEEAATGRRIEVVATARSTGTPASNQPAASGVVVMRRATMEGTALCGTSGMRLPRDCSYLAMAESLALLAVLAEPWIASQSVDTAPAPAVARLAEALRQAPDADFDAGWQGYQAASDRARAMLGGAGGSGIVDPGGFVRSNDVRAYCIADARDALVQSVVDRGTEIPGVARPRATAAATTMRGWITARYGTGAAIC